MADADFTHIALHVTNLEASLSFCREYAQLRVFDERSTPDGSRVAWLASESRRFVLVLGMGCIRHVVSSVVAQDCFRYCEEVVAGSAFVQ